MSLGLMMLPLDYFTGSLATAGISSRAPTTPRYEANLRDTFSHEPRRAFVQVHGTEVRSLYHHGYKTAPGNARNSYESLVKYGLLGDETVFNTTLRLFQAVPWC